MDVVGVILVIDMHDYKSYI